MGIGCSRDFRFKLSLIYKKSMKLYSPLIWMNLLKFWVVLVEVKIRGMTNSMISKITFLLDGVLLHQYVSSGVNWKFVLVKLNVMNFIVMLELWGRKGSMKSENYDSFVTISYNNCFPVGLLLILLYVTGR